MSEWHSGYVVDIGYTHGFYREFSPPHLALTQLLASAHKGSVHHFCELGCGQGFAINLLAAANPQIAFHAVDFNPAQIAGAQRLAAKAELSNITFHEASFAEFAQRTDLPLFDVIVLHGIYSWVASEHRATLIDILRSRLRPGGLVYISYNALPGWAAAAPLRELIYRHALHGKGVDRLSGALAFTERLEQLGALYFKSNPAAGPKLAKLKKENSSYLAHELLNATWKAFYHAEVVEDLAAAKLEFLASADALDHIESINLTVDQQHLLAEIAEPALRETTRDYLVNRQFRRDTFVRGRLALASIEVREAWLSLRVALTLVRSDIPSTVSGVLGEATLQPQVYDPILDALSEGPRTLQQLSADTRLTQLDFATLQQAITVLIGAGHLAPCLPEEGESIRAASTRAFNLAVLERARHGEELQFLASPVTGSGHHLGRCDQLFLVYHQTRREDSPEHFVWKTLSSQGLRVLKDGIPLQDEAANLAELRSRYTAFLAKRLPVLQQLGIA